MLSRRMAAFGREALLLFLLLGNSVFGAVETTTIQGKVVSAAALPVSGTVTLSLSVAGAALDGSNLVSVVGYYRTTIDPNGNVLSLSVVPNDAMIPSGTHYNVTIAWRDSAGRTGNTQQKWSVPTFPDPVQIGAVQRLDTAPAISSYLDHLTDVQITSPTNLDVLEYQSSSGLWTNSQTLNSHKTATSGVHGIGALSSVVGTGTTQTLTGKTIDGGGTGNTLQVRRKPTTDDCRNVAGKPGELCQTDGTNTVLICADADVSGSCSFGEWQAVGTGGAGFIATSIVDVKGDLIAADAADSVVRVPVGAAGSVLEADPNQSAGLRMRYIDQVAWGTTGGFAPNITTGAAYWSDRVANRVYCWRVTVPQGERLSIDQVSYYMGPTNDVSADLAACIYSADGSALLANNDNCSTSTASATINCTLSYTMLPDSYNFCITSASAAWQSSRFTNPVIAPSRRLMGYQTGGGTSCPATITYPYVTAWGQTQMPLFMLEDAP